LGSPACWGPRPSRYGFVRCRSDCRPLISVPRTTGGLLANDESQSRLPGGSGIRIQGLAHSLRESDGCERFLQERGSLLDALLEDDILRVPGHEHDFHAGPKQVYALGISSGGLKVHKSEHPPDEGAPYSGPYTDKAGWRLTSKPSKGLAEAEGIAPDKSGYTIQASRDAGPPLPAIQAGSKKAAWPTERCQAGSFQPENSRYGRITPPEDCRWHLPRTAAVPPTVRAQGFAGDSRIAVKWPASSL
jgi:hypothetical protein